jgi:hypothetical protein
MNALKRMEEAEIESNGRADGGCRPALLRYRPSGEQVPETSLTEVTRSCGIELDELDDDDALPGSPVGLAPVALLELPAPFDIVPFTSTFFPTRLDISDALPLSR